jgi:CHRD domain
MRRTKLVCALSLFATSLLVGANAIAHGGKDHDSIRVHMKGFEEAPAVISGASGLLELDINDAAGSIAYELTYQGLEGTVTQAHIHIGQKNVSGGIAIWLCQTAANPAPAAVAAATPQCPGPNAGTVAGTLNATSVIGPTAQAVPVGAFADVIKAIRAGKAYGNVHSTAAPGGEVRGQIED